MSSSEEEQKIEVEPAMWTLGKFGEVFRMVRSLKKKTMDYNPVMKRSVNVTRMITEALQALRQMFSELRMQKQQFPHHDVLPEGREEKCPLLKTLSHQHHLRLTSSNHHRFRLLSLLRLPKKMILMTLLLFLQKVSSQTQRHNAYTITPLHLLVVGIVLSTYHRSHRHHHQ